MDFIRGIRVISGQSFGSRIGRAVEGLHILGILRETLLWPADLRPLLHSENPFVQFCVLRAVAACSQPGTRPRTCEAGGQLRMSSDRWALPAAALGFEGGGD